MPFIILLWYHQKQLLNFDIIYLGHYVKKYLCKITLHLHYQFMGKVPKRFQLQEGIFSLEEKELAAEDTEMKKWAKQLFGIKEPPVFWKLRQSRDGKYILSLDMERKCTFKVLILTDGCTIRRQGEKLNQTYTHPHACDCNYLLICLSEKKRRFIPAICSNTRLYIL